MDKYKDLNREQLEKIVDALTDLALGALDAQTVETILRNDGFESEELQALGFDVGV